MGMKRLAAALAIAAGLSAASPGAVAAQEAPGCRFTLQGARVWTGERFEPRDLHVDGATFAASATAGAPVMPASWMVLIPPLVDAHTHGLDEPAAANDPMHRHNLRLGIYYALNPNNIRRDAPGAPFGPDQVEALYAGGGVTGPGGHPRPLYEMMARTAQLRGVNMGTLPGRAFHEASTAEEARAAVDRVRAAGSRIVKLYLLDHRAADSKGLTPETFRAAAAHARALGMRVIAHVDSAADFRLAVATPGVAALMHMPGTLPVAEADATYLLTAEDAAAARAANVAVVPTVSVMFHGATGAPLLRAQRIQAHNLRLLRDAGVSLVAGADRPGATMVDELNLLRATGLFDGTQLLNIGTLNGLRLLYPDRRIGTFQPGGEASFLVMFADPRRDWFWIDDAMAGIRGGRIINDPVGLLGRLCGGTPPAR